MPLYEDVAKQAGQVAQQTGSAAGEALDAYHLASSTANARQQLEMQKQNNDMNKANSIISQIHTISKLPPASQKLALQSLQKSMPQMVPGFNPGIMDALIQDQASRQAAFLTAAPLIKNGGIHTPEEAQQVLSVWGGDIPAALEFLHKNAEISTKAASAELMADFRGRGLDLREDRVAETKNQNAISAGKEFEHDPIIKLSKTNLNSLTRSQSILDNPNKPVTAKDLNLAYTDYINAVAAGGAATEGKISRELPENFAVEFNNLKSKFGEFDDLRKSPAGRKLIGMLTENIGTVRRDIKDAVAEQAYNLHTNYSRSTNPQVLEASKAKLNLYAPDKYDELYGNGGRASTPTAAPAKAPLLDFGSWQKQQRNK